MIAKHYITQASASKLNIAISYKNALLNSIIDPKLQVAMYMRQANHSSFIFTTVDYFVCIDRKQKQIQVALI